MDDATTPQVSGPTGEAELPNPTFSETSDRSPSVDADAIVSRLTPFLEQLIEQKVQSTKDKRFSKIEKALGGRLDLLAELESEGVNISKEVRTQMEIRELRDQIAQQSTQPVPVRDNGLSQPKTAVTDAIAELSKYELDQNDPAFLELLRGRYANRAEFDLAVQKHIVGKLKPPKPANPADVVQSPARTPATGNAAAQIEQGYLEEMKTVPRGNVRMAANVKAKWRKKAAEAGLQLNV